VRITLNNQTTNRGLDADITFLIPCKIRIRSGIVEAVDPTGDNRELIVQENHGRLDFSLVST
jgi:hypothetical protein